MEQTIKTEDATVESLEGTVIKQEAVECYTCKQEYKQEIKQEYEGECKHECKDEIKEEPVECVHKRKRTLEEHIDNALQTGSLGLAGIQLAVLSVNIILV